MPDPVVVASEGVHVPPDDHGALSGFDEGAGDGEDSVATGEHV